MLGISFLSLPPLMPLKMVALEMQHPDTNDIECEFEELLRRAAALNQAILRVERESSLSILSARTTLGTKIRVFVP
jgi:hypothetical protein